MSMTTRSIKLALGIALALCAALTGCAHRDRNVVCFSLGNTQKGGGGFNVCRPMTQEEMRERDRDEEIAKMTIDPVAQPTAVAIDPSATGLRENCPVWADYCGVDATKSHTVSFNGRTPPKRAAQLTQRSGWAEIK